MGMLINTNNSKIYNKKTLFGFLALVFIVFLTVGFSSFSINLDFSDLSAYVMAQADIRVTNVGLSNTTSNATSNWENFNVSNITSSVILPNSDSTVTYEIVVTNVGNVKEGIFDIDEIYKIAGTNTDSSLEIKNISINLKEALCDNTNSSQCSLGAVSTFYITIGYTSSGYNGTNITHNIELDFDFRRVFDISYSGFNNLSGLPTQMISGDTKTITFDSTTGIPNSVTVSGATSSYTSPTLTLTNVNDNIVITGSFGGGGTPGVEVVTNDDGSIITITKSDDGNGNVITTGYDIDTTIVQAGSIPVPSGGFDTGVLVFDGHDLI